MAFRFETANERWQWFSMGGGEEHAGEWEFPEQTKAAIRKRFQDGASMQQVKQEYAKFIEENQLTDNDLYEIGISAPAPASGEAMQDKIRTDLMAGLPVEDIRRKHGLQ